MDILLRAILFSAAAAAVMAVNGLMNNSTGAAEDDIIYMYTGDMFDCHSVGEEIECVLRIMADGGRYGLLF